MPCPGATRDHDRSRECPSRSGKPRAHLLGEGGHLLHELVAIGGEEFENQVSNAAVRQLDELIDQGSSLAGEHPSTVGRSRHALARPKAAPIPRMKRPPLSASSDETILAVTTGFRYGTMRTVVPSRTRLVAPATTASVTSGSNTVSPKLTTLACGTTT